MEIASWVLVVVGLITSQTSAQFNFGSLFGGGNNNNNRPRLDLGQLASGFLNQLGQNQGNNNNNNRNPGNDLVGAVINAGINQVLTNTNITLGTGSNGLPSINLGPKNPTNNNNNQEDGEKCVGNGRGRPNVGVRSGIGSAEGDCDCWDRNFDYFGADLRISDNPSQVKNAQECQKKCQSFPECSNWTWEKRRGRNVRTSKCWLKSNGFNKRRDGNRISGPVSCSPDIPSVQPPSPTVSCTTVGGGDVGASCRFPFKYKDQSYSGCILVDADDGIPWCSTLTDGDGQHVGGQGKWGHCPGSCPKDNGVTATTRRPIRTTRRPTTTTRRPTTTTTKRTTPRPAPLRECGTNAKRFSTRIVGGRPADPDEWPWLAALVHKGGSGSSSQYCGATLISDQHVLTAAHCLAPFNQKDIQVKLGEYDFDAVGETKDQTFDVLWMKNHENYNDATYANDIAMIKLDGAATRSKSVWPICLPPPTETFTNRRAFVIGWGTIYFGGPTSSTLQEVNVRVWNPDTCKKNYAGLGRNVLDTMLCAGETNRDSCQGDSGGPLNCLSPKTRRWELCGVVSWGAKCAEPEFPGVYTRVTKYLDWIDNNSN